MTTLSHRAPTKVPADKTPESTPFRTPARARRNTSQALSRVGFVKWFAGNVAAGMSGHSPFAPLLCLTLGIMGMLMPYATGPSPVYHGSGYLPARGYWILGEVFGAIYIATFLLIGMPRMAMMR